MSNQLIIDKRKIPALFSCQG